MHPERTDTWPPRMTGAEPKPAKGTALMERREIRADIKAHEREEKEKVRQRDGDHVCRLVPQCREQEKHETAHLDDKGMGGDHGVRTSAETMIRACFFHHQGEWSLHSKDLRVEYLTPEQCNGPIEVWGRVDGEWVMVKRESACGINERD